MSGMREGFSGFGGDTKPFSDSVRMYEEQERVTFVKKSRKRMAIIAISSVVLVVVVVATVVGACLSRGNDRREDSSESFQTPQESIRAVCQATLYPQSCFSALNSSIAGRSITNPVELFIVSLEVAMKDFLRVVDLPTNLSVGVNETLLSTALGDCQLLIHDSIDNLNASISAAQTASGGSGGFNETAVEDLRTLLSAALTNIDTCLSGLENTTGGFLERMQVALGNTTEFTSNSLAIVTKILSILSKVNLPAANRRLLAVPTSNDFPSWLLAADRKLLEDAGAPAKADIVVAQDGSGDVRKINEAIERVPKMSAKRFMIYVKKGVYAEHVEVDKKTTNLMIVGDGMDATIVTGSLSVVGGTSTFRSATFATVGKGFIARDIGFRNTAGPQNHQAVALRSGADFSVFYRCKFDAYQDTLYVHSNRQFYRDCLIMGTVDFIFGNAAVVFQNCQIRPKEPMPGQKDTITAQAKSDPNQNTGISIHGCQILAPNSATIKAQVFLGRPWKVYSTTVVMNTVIGSLVDPAGWLPWTGDSAPSTIFYAEFHNTGPGSSTQQRVKWKGYHSDISQAQASKFTVANFIGGSSWLPNTGVPFTAGL
ncbi:Pectinesterase 3 [Nymphaea thermarum]|nr:Pectinesterase 3 [Nymphaea thermarum]